MIMGIKYELPDRNEEVIINHIENVRNSKLIEVGLKLSGLDEKQFQFQALMLLSAMIIDDKGSDSEKALLEEVLKDV